MKLPEKDREILFRKGFLKFPLIHKPIITLLYILNCKLYVKVRKNKNSYIDIEKRVPYNIKGIFLIALENEFISRRALVEIFNFYSSKTKLHIHEFLIDNESSDYWMEYIETRDPGHPYFKFEKDKEIFNYYFEHVKNSKDTELQKEMFKKI